jgi:hypothetical protein
MSRRQRQQTAKEIAAVGSRIEHWRRTREKRSPMPETLWREATRLARAHGVGPISRQLRLGYASLQKRVAVPEGEQPERQACDPGFVELSAAQLLGGGMPTGAVMELTADDGRRLTVRFDHAEQLDVPGLVATFLGR